MCRADAPPVVDEDVEDAERDDEEIMQLLPKECPQLLSAPLEDLLKRDHCEEAYYARLT